MKRAAQVHASYTRRTTIASVLVLCLALAIGATWLVFTAKAIRRTAFAGSGISGPASGQLESVQRQIEQLWSTQRVRVLINQQLHALQQRASAAH